MASLKPGYHCEVLCAALEMASCVEDFEHWNILVLTKTHCYDFITKISKHHSLALSAGAGSSVVQKQYWDLGKVGAPSCCLQGKVHTTVFHGHGVLWELDAQPQKWRHQEAMGLHLTCICSFFPELSHRAAISQVYSGLWPTSESSLAPKQLCFPYSLLFKKQWQRCPLHRDAQCCTIEQLC